MSFMPTGAPGIGNAMVRVGADFRGMSASTSKAMTQFRGQMAAGTQGLGTANKQAAALGNNMDTAAKKASKLGLAIRGMAIGLGAVGIGMGVMAIKAAMDFESAFAGVKKTVDASEKDLEKLRKSFLALAEAIPVSASQLARVGEAAGALGIPTESIIEFVKVVSTIGTTTDVSTDAAATALGQLSNVLNMTEQDYQRFASTLVDLGNKGASTESQIIEITRRMGSAAKLFGISTDQILALGSSAANLGMQPQLAASSLQRLIMRLVSVSGGMSSVDEITSKAGISVADFTKIVETGGDKLDKFADTTGFSSKELTKIQAGLESLDALKMALGLTQQQFEKLQRAHPEQIIEGMFRAMRDMDAGERQLFIQRIMGPAASAGGGVGLQQLMLGLADSVDRNLTPSLRNAAVAWSVNNAAVKEAEKRYATTGSQLQQLQNTFTGILIEAGTGSLPMVADVLGKIREAIPNIADAIGNAWDIVQGPMQQVGDALFRMGNTLQDIVLEWGGGGSAEGLLGSLDVMATLTQTVAHWLTAILDTTTQILSQPAINALAKMAMLWGGIAIAFKGMAALRNFAVGAAMGVGSLLGRPVQSLGRSFGMAGMSPSDKIQMEAAALQQKAAMTNMAAASMEATTSRIPPLGMIPGGPGVMPRAAFPSGVPVSPRPLGYIPPSPMQFGSPVGPAARSFAVFEKAGLTAAGRTGAMNSLKAFGSGMMSAVGRGVSAVGSGLSQGFGLIARAFWPLFIADLVGNLIAAPIGDIIGKATGMKRLAAAWGRGWMEGLMGTFQTWMEGSDAFVGRPGEYQLAKDLPISRSNIQTLAGDGAGRDAVTAILDDYEASQTEEEQTMNAARLAEWLAGRSRYLERMKAELSAMQSGSQTVMEGFVYDTVEAYLNSIPDLEKAYEASREELQDLAIKVFREAGVDVPLGQIANLESDAVAKALRALQAVPTDAPAGLASMVARAMTALPATTSTGNPLEDLKAGIEGVKTEMVGLEQVVGTVEPELRTALTRIFDLYNNNTDLLQDIQDADTRVDKAAIIRSMTEAFPDAADLKASQKKRVDDYWSQLLEIYGYTMGTLGLADMQRLANDAGSKLSDSILQQLLGGDIETPLSELVAAAGATLSDQVGESDISDRTAKALLNAVGVAFKKAGDDKSALRGLMAKLLEDAAPEMLSGMNLRDVILAAAAPQLEGKTREEQGKVLKRLRTKFGEDNVPKNVSQLRRELKAPKVKEWREYFEGMNEAATDPKTGVKATVTEVDTEVNRLVEVVQSGKEPAMIAAESLGAAVAEPIEALPGRIAAVLPDIRARIEELVALMVPLYDPNALKEGIAPPSEPPPGMTRKEWEAQGRPTEGSGGGSGRGDGGGGRRRRPTRERVAPRIRGRASRRGAPSGATRTVSANLGGSVSQTINVDRLELHSDSQRQSALESLSFLAPLG